MKIKMCKSFLCSVFFLGAVLTAINLQAQALQGPSQLGEPTSTQEYQVRLFALQLCKQFYLVNSSDYVNKINEYITNMEAQLNGAPAYSAGPLEKYVLEHPQDALSQRYIKCQAVVAFPDAFGYDAAALTGIQDELNSIALQIRSIAVPVVPETKD